MFVGDINNGLLYRFTPNEARDEIVLDNTFVGNIDALEDNEIGDPKENQPLVFGQGFGGITDIQVGPEDGYLYVLSHTGDLHRIVPISESINTSAAGGTNQTSSFPSLSSSSQEEQQHTVNSVPSIIMGIDGDDSYSPNPIEIRVGQTITWYNGDTISHIVTSGEDGDPDEGILFDSDAIIPNQTFNLTFNEGEFPYYCIYHPSMVGEIVVQEGEEEVEDGNEN